MSAENDLQFGMLFTNKMLERKENQAAYNFMISYSHSVETFPNGKVITTNHNSVEEKYSFIKQLNQKLKS